MTKMRQNRKNVPIPAQQILSIVIVIGLLFGLSTPTLAYYNTLDFSDVPQSHWAYPFIMEMADAGIIQGTGGGQFSPEETLSAEMFITLVGRVMFPEIKVQGGDWSGPYVAAMKDRGFLENTNITDETLSDDISRYDMAMILAWCLKSLSGIAELSSSFRVTDLEEMPYHYMDAVEFVCAAGLIRGDENHRFNGANSMTRQEAAVVIARLSFAKRNLEGDFPTALTVKDHALSVADMDYYYYGYLNTVYEQERMLESIYATSGLSAYTPSFDPSSSLKTQYVDEDKTQSYHAYFLDQAKTYVSQVLALSDAALAQGYTMSPEGQAALEEVRADLDKQVKMYSFFNREGYLKSLYGLRMTEAVYFKNLELVYLAQDYREALANAIGGYSEEALTAYYNDHVGQLNSYDYDYIWFDGTAEEGADGAAAWADAKRRAETMLAAIQSSDGSPNAFSVAAKIQGGSPSTVTALQGHSFSAEPYAPWMMDPSRRDGDTALFHDDRGYYVVQFHKAYRDDTPRVDFRHILLRTETEDGEARARELLAQFLAGERTAEAFGALADQYSEDTRNWEDKLLSPGGLCAWTEQGYTPQPIDDWCFDPQRQPGDTALVQSEFGWHVMYFQGRHLAWMGQAEEDMKSEAQGALNSQILVGYEPQEGPGWVWVGLGAEEIAG